MKAVGSLREAGEEREGSYVISKWKWPVMTQTEI